MLHSILVRFTCLAVLLAAVGCGGAAGEPTTPSPSRPTATASIENCLVDGRSLEFDNQVRGWFRLFLAKEAEREQIAPGSVPNFNPRPGGVRTGSADGTLYRYTTEFTFVRVVDGWEFTILASGTVDAATCVAVLEDPPRP